MGKAYLRVTCGAREMHLREACGDGVAMGRWSVTAFGAVMECGQTSNFCRICVQMLRHSGSKCVGASGFIASGRLSGSNRVGSTIVGGCYTRRVLHCARLMGHGSISKCSMARLVRCLVGSSVRMYFDSCTAGFVGHVTSRKRRHGTGGCHLTMGRLRECLKAAEIVFARLSSSILAE